MSSQSFKGQALQEKQTHQIFAVKYKTTAPQLFMCCLHFYISQGNIWLGSLCSSKKFSLKSISKLIFVMDPNCTLNFGEIQIHVSIHILWLNSSHSLKMKMFSCSQLKSSAIFPQPPMGDAVFEQVFVSILSELCSKFQLNSVMKKLFF